MESNLNKIMEAIKEDILTLFNTIAEDDSFMTAENWIRRQRRHSANTIKDSDAVRNTEVQMKGNIFEMYYPDYLFYVNYGRHPYPNDPSKKPPIEAIREWCQRKGLGTDNKTVYAIRQTVWKYGIKPRPILSLFVQNLDYMWEKDWSDKLANEIISKLNNFFNE